MRVASIEFELRDRRSAKDAVAAIHGLLGAWRGNGQILERGHPIARTKTGFTCYVMLPDAVALQRGWDNEWVAKRIASLPAVGLGRPRVRILGAEAESPDEDRCKKRPSLILYTTYVSMESPLRCGACFLPVPLYLMPRDRHGEQNDVMCWQSDYQACDGLQMNTATGERFGTHQISAFDSSLSKRGRAIAKRIEEASKTPTYYYLYRYGGRSGANERKRRCPGCGGAWLLRDGAWHDLFHFRCKRCRLLSNIAWNVR